MNQYLRVSGTASVALWKRFSEAPRTTGVKRGAGHNRALRYDRLLPATVLVRFTHRRFRFRTQSGCNKRLTKHCYAGSV